MPLHTELQSRGVRDPNSKAGRIRALLAQGMTPQQVAPLIPCSDAYVRLIRKHERDPSRPVWKRYLKKLSPEVKERWKRHAAERKVIASLSRA